MIYTYGYSRRLENREAETLALLEQMVRANLVTAIGRKRHTVRKEQDIAHQPRARQARSRAMKGPIVLASRSGSFFQSSILRE